MSCSYRVLGLFLFSSPSLASYFNFALQSTDVVKSRSNAHPNLELVFDTCALYAPGVAVSFSRSRWTTFTRSATPQGGPVLLQQSPWKLSSVTCGSETHAAISAAALRVEADTCEDLLLVSAASHESLAFRKSLYLCYPLTGVSPRARDAMLAALQTGRPLDVSSGLSVAAFASAFATVAGTFSNSGSSPNHGICLVQNDQASSSLTLDVRTGKLVALTCPFARSNDLDVSVFFTMADVETDCTLIAKMIDFNALCATVEDLTQVLVYAHSGQMDADVCRLENAFSRSRVVMERSPLRRYPNAPWKLENVSCDSYGDSVIMEPSPAVTEAANRFGRRARGLGPTVAMNSRNQRDNIVDLSCIGLRIDQLSGISFNQFCTRRPV